MNVQPAQRQKQVRRSSVLRTFRKAHRITAAILFVFFFIMSVTGILLAWKKNSAGYILPETQTGTTSQLQRWLPLDSLHQKAMTVLEDSVSPQLSQDLNRIDIRKQRGTVKFIFSSHYYEIQLDGATGEVLQIAHRNSDLIEGFHDGTFLDQWLGTRGEPVKLVYSTIMGLALLLFTVTGFYLWYARRKRRRKASPFQ